MAGKDRTTQSYAQVPHATLSDRAASATRRRVAEQQVEARIEAAVVEELLEKPHKWACAGTADLLGACARVRVKLSET